MTMRQAISSAVSGRAMADEVVTRTRRYHMDDDGILRMTVLPGAEETLADAVENVRAGAALRKGRSCPTLSDSRWLKSVSREARAYYGGTASAEVATAVAVLIGSALQRTIVNFILVFSKPRFPVRFFTSEAEALAWLRAFLR